MVSPWNLIICLDGSEGIGKGSLGRRGRGKKRMTMGRKRKGGEGIPFHPHKELFLSYLPKRGHSRCSVSFGRDERASWEMTINIWLQIDEVKNIPDFVRRKFSVV